MQLYHPSSVIKSLLAFVHHDLCLVLTGAVSTLLWHTGMPFTCSEETMGE